MAVVSDTDARAHQLLDSVIDSVAPTISTEDVTKMVFLFSDVLSKSYLCWFFNPDVTNCEKIRKLIYEVAEKKEATHCLVVNIWAELLYVSKNYRHLKTVNMCKHEMDRILTNKRFSSDFMWLLISLGDELSDDDLNDIWINLVKGNGPCPNQPELLFSYMKYEMAMQDDGIIERLLHHLSTRNRNDLIQLIHQYKEKHDNFQLTGLYDLDFAPDSSHCGVALIFNNKTFERDYLDLPKLEERVGTDKDAEDLKELWEGYGIRTFVFNNTTTKQFYDHFLTHLYWLEDKRYSSTIKIFIVCILSHGDEGVFCCSDSFTVGINYVEDCLGRNLNLAGIPKLLFVQACQGNNVQIKVNNRSLAQSLQLDGPNDSSPVTPRPLYSDMLIGVSTIPGFVSIRDPR